MKLVDKLFLSFESLKVIIFEPFKKMNLIVFQYRYIRRRIIVNSFQKMNLLNAPI